MKNKHSHNIQYANLHHWVNKSKNRIRQILNLNIFEIYNRIDPPLRKHFSKMLFELFFFFIIAISCSISFKSILLFISFSIITISLIGILLFRIIKCIEGDVCKLNGICLEIFKPAQKFLKKKLFARDYIIIQTSDNKYVKIYNISPYKIRLNNELFIYFPKTNIRRINEDSYEISSPYYIYINKFNSFKEFHKK